MCYFVFVISGCPPKRPSFVEGSLVVRGLWPGDDVAQLLRRASGGSPEGKNFTLSLRATMSSGLVIYTAPNVDEARRRRRAQQSTLAKRRRVSQYKKEQTASCSVVSPSAAEVCARAAEVCARRVHPPVQCARAAEVCARRVHPPVQAVAARTLRPALHRAEALPGACIVSDDMPMLLRALMSIKLRTNVRLYQDKVEYRSESSRSYGGLHSAMPPAPSGPGAKLPKGRARGCKPWGTEWL